MPASEGDSELERKIWISIERNFSLRRAFRSAILKKAMQVDTPCIMNASPWALRILHLMHSSPESPESPLESCLESGLWAPGLGSK